MCIWDIISVIKDPSLISVCCYIYTDKGVNNVPSGFDHSPPLLYSKTTVLNESPYRHHSGIYQSGRKFLSDFSQPTSHDNTMTFFKKQHFWNHYLNILKMLFLFFRHINLFFFCIKSLLLSINAAFEVKKFYHFSLWIALFLPEWIP